MVRMHPNVRRDLALFGQPDHVHRRSVSRRSARSAFQRRLEFPNRSVARAPDRIQRQTGSRFAAFAHDLEPAIAAVEALRDGRRWLRRAAETFHPFRPQMTLRGVRLARGLQSALASVSCLDFGAPDPITENPPSVLSAHRAITATAAHVGKGVGQAGPCIFSSGRRGGNGRFSSLF